MNKLLTLSIVVMLVGCASTSTSWVSDPSDPNNVKIEKAIRYQISNILGIDKGELTKEMLEKVTEMSLTGNKLTDVKGLEKLTGLKGLNCSNNPDLTKAQIVALQKALPKCKIHSDHNLPSP